MNKQVTTKRGRLNIAEGSAPTQPDAQELSHLYRAMLTAREIDRVEDVATRRGEAFFHVSGKGHEGSAALALHLTNDDWLHCHYRDKALMVARGITARAFFDGFYCKDASHSRGRQMSAHMCDASLRVASVSGPVGNGALHAVGMALAGKDMETRPIVLFSCGDGTTQEGEFLESCAEAARAEAPVLFFVEDNGWAISTPTAGKTFYALHAQRPDAFHGIPIHRIDGRDAIQAWRELGPIVARMRRTRQPAIVVFQVARIANHTNADDQSIYRDAADIKLAEETCDPIPILEDQLLDMGWSAADLAAAKDEIARQVAEADEAAAFGPDPEPMLTADVAPSAAVAEALQPGRARKPAAAPAPAAVPNTPQTMGEAIRAVLRGRLADDPRVYLWGEDIEDPKGDVFGVTKGLSTQFPKRVVNAPLTESTIVGVAIGRAMAGERPVAFLQFADFLPLAYNQIVSELGSMAWRTDGALTAPVIIMVPCGGYRPGLGPFHASSFESLMTHTPGIDVVMPSTAEDAAGLLNAAFESTRPTVFFYPKSCLNDPRGAMTGDAGQVRLTPGSARKVLSGRDLTMVGWGNTVRLCEQAAEALEKAGVEAEVLDLRSLGPWDKRAVLSSAETSGRLLVVHEDNHTNGFGAEILATVGEQCRTHVAMRRVTRPDTYVPCNFANQIEVLPSFKRVLETAADMLDIDVEWTPPPAAEEGIVLVEAIGSGPTDETVDVVELMVEVGQTVERGEEIAALEAIKSVFELTSPASGVIEEIVVGIGETVPVGAPLMKIRTDDTTQRAKPLTHEAPGTPTLTRRAKPAAPAVAGRGEGAAAQPAGTLRVGLSQVATVTGSRVVPNEELVQGRTDDTYRDAEKLTGIRARHWAAEGETVLSLGVRAVRAALEANGLTADDLDLVICSTTTPDQVTPSVAYRILRDVAGERGNPAVAAYDINAACSGYLYALQAAHDFLQNQPQGRVLVVTAEVLSRLLDRDDPSTVLVFGDAASATVVYGDAHFDGAAARLFRPDISGKSDDRNALTVPVPGQGYVRMDGQRVFREAVRAMVGSLNRVCAGQGLGLGDLDMVVPHQANQRIIDAIAQRTGANAYSNIKHFGNTSSTSIPLCLAEVLPDAPAGQRLGLCAFGGGYTYAAAVLETV